MLRPSPLPLGFGRAFGQCVPSLIEECAAWLKAELRLGSGRTPGFPCCLLLDPSLFRWFELVDGEVSSQTVDSLFDFVNNAWNLPLLAATFDALSAKAIATLPPLVQILG